MPDPIERLILLFERFPGIGPRQAQRFVQFLLRSSPATRREFVESVQALGRSVHQCNECMRFFSGDEATCNICASSSRDPSCLAIIANDADLLALERSGTFQGRYFVLGGTLHLGSEKMNGLRIKQLFETLPKRKELKEIILAFPANPEGDATAERLRDELQQQGSTIKITSLGRGLSTGSEIEYADSDTIKSALDGRR
jgi:recombination protein RecR